ncbi:MULTISPECIES: 3-oxoacyl-ACP reductase FabG [Candidatus Ichthyocystis]|uniref:3-oxoacyl-[acyl-carrier-protein] reductase n=1 Tax=Candidatus Ichthyocystis hellenicum TaxID=1561003 RepID=A0A0S4M4F4_9BURK|nr:MULTISPECIES: 3-oxoacyl-ACP reductase FabG [Ichthyocystis]CUT17594.1 3-oxoacyl-[acyl-carrier-protein] reductase [Candidatus Ichthyocystis hellenicum]
MDMNQSKVFVVTGASRGIGRSIFSRLNEKFRDAIVVGTSTTNDGADGITECASSNAWSGRGYVLNIENIDSCQSFVEKVRSDFGAVSVLVNNAGITNDGLAVMMRQDDWDSVIATNLTGPFVLTKLLLKPMIRARWGRIVNVTSVVAYSGNPGQANYVAAKSGLVGLTKSLALEMASRQITVNCVAPGFIDTDMTGKLNDQQRDLVINSIPLGYVGSPDDVAAAVEFLVSDSARYITGTTIHVNGGLCLN